MNFTEFSWAPLLLNISGLLLLCYKRVEIIEINWNIALEWNNAYHLLTLLWRYCSAFDVLLRIIFVIGPLVPPSNITATNTTRNGKSAVLLEWNIGDEDSTNDPWRHFSITCPLCEKRNYPFTNLSSTEKKVVIPNLLAYVTYTLRITTFSNLADLTQIYLWNTVTFTTETGGSV